MIKDMLFPAVAALVIGHAPYAEPPFVVTQTPSVDVHELLDGARGAAPLLCWYASKSVSGNSDGRAWDLPYSALGDDVTRRARSVRRDTLDARDRERLGRAMRSNDDCEREIAARITGHRHREFDASELADLLTRLLTDELSTTRISAAIAAGLARTGEVLETLHLALDDADHRVRANSAWAAGRIRHADSAPRLSRALDDSDATVRATALGALARIGTDDPTLLRVLRQDASANVRRVAAWALSRSRTSAAVAGLTQAMREDADEDVREMAAWALAHAGDREAAEALGEVVRADRSARVRATAAWAVGQLRPRTLPTGVIAGISDGDRETRLRSAWAAGQVRDPAALPALRAAVGGETDERTRRALVRALVLTGERDAESLSALLAAEDEEVRRLAVMALAGRRSPMPWPWPQPRPYP